MSDEKLEGILAKYRPGDTPFVAAASNELQRRRLEKVTTQLSTPHWTLIPAFWAIIATMIFAAISAWPVVRAWLQSSPVSDKSAIVQPPQSQSMPKSQSETKTLPSESSLAKP